MCICGILSVSLLQSSILGRFSFSGAFSYLKNQIFCNTFKNTWRQCTTSIISIEQLVWPPVRLNLLEWYYTYNCCNWMKKFDHIFKRIMSETVRGIENVRPYIYIYICFWINIFTQIYVSERFFCLIVIVFLFCFLIVWDYTFNICSGQNLKCHRWTQGLV